MNILEHLLNKLKMFLEIFLTEKSDVGDMNKLLKQTENVVKSSTTQGAEKQGFATMSFSEYK